MPPNYGKDEAERTNFKTRHLGHTVHGVPVMQDIVSNSRHLMYLGVWEQMVCLGRREFMHILPL